MVDFQARDTRRGPTEDADSESKPDTAPTEETESKPDTAPTEETDSDGTDRTPQPAQAGQADTDGEEPTSQAAEPTAAPPGSVDVAVVTVTGDRGALEDSVRVAFESAGHTVVRSERLRGGYDAIQQMVETLVAAEGVDAVVTVGGVGLGTDEMAIEAVHPLLEKALPGFGEAFRARLADHIGTGIVGVRSTAGVSEGTLVFCLPGDAEAAELAVSEILAVEVPELAAELH